MRGWHIAAALAEGIAALAALGADNLGHWNGRRGRRTAKGLLGGRHNTSGVALHGGPKQRNGAPLRKSGHGLEYGHKRARGAGLVDVLLAFAGMVADVVGFGDVAAAGDVALHTSKVAGKSWAAPSGGSELRKLEWGEHGCIG